MFKFKKNNKKGFSLIELIVVIAIMAVIAVVLVPALLSYVEESRAGKDIKTTDELVNSVELALTEQDVYDELLEHAVEDNVSCYIDKINENECSSKTTIKATTNNMSEWYEFGNDDRLLDETPYYGAGNMRGVTITFTPIKDSNESHYIIKDAVINKFIGRNTGYLYENEKIYNRIRSANGDTFTNTSQTYRNSDFTIFIRMGTTGGNEAANQDAVKVYGQFNGTNLQYDDIQTCKIASNRTIGDVGSNDSYVNEIMNSKNASILDFGENSLMGSGTVYSSGANVYDLMNKDASEAYINDLKTNNEINYYSSLSLAIGDVNNNRIGVGSNATEAEANVGVYIENGVTKIVLLKNVKATERLSISKDVTLDLAGNVLSFENSVVGIDATDGKVTFNNTIKGSRIQITGTGGNTAIAIQSNTDIEINGGNTLTIYAESDSGQARALNMLNGNINISNCNIEAFSKSYAAFGIYGFGNLTNCTINVKSEGTHAYGIYNTIGNANITNCKIDISSDDGNAYAIDCRKSCDVSGGEIKVTTKTSRGVGIAQSNNTTTLIKNCNINMTSTEGYSYGILQYTDSVNQSTTISDGKIVVNGSGIGVLGSLESNSLTLNNAYVEGGRGVEAQGNAEINGGTYIGKTGNAISLCKENGIYYVQDAIINSPNTEDGLNIFSGNNITVYVNNCDISSVKHPIWIGAIENSSYYVSNTRINLDCENGIRLRSETNHLYIGVGNNFTIDNVYDYKECVTITNETYKKQ